MAVRYNKLWKLLIDKNMSKTDLIKTIWKVYKKTYKKVGGLIC